LTVGVPQAKILLLATDASTIFRQALLLPSPSTRHLSVSLNFSTTIVLGRTQIRAGNVHSQPSFPDLKTALESISRPSPSDGNAGCLTHLRSLKPSWFFVILGGARALSSHQYPSAVLFPSPAFLDLVPPPSLWELNERLQKPLPVLFALLF